MRGGSLPSPEARELALLLVHKAEGDEAILDRLLDDHNIPDDVLGFHVQQAVEKRLKAILSFNEVEYDRTHSIGYLTSVLEQAGIDLPECREQIEELTPWAVAARYEDSFEEVLDRASARKLIAILNSWTDRLLADSEPQAGDGGPQGQA